MRKKNMELPYDVHHIIISMLDYNAVLAYKQISKYANAIVHQVHKQLYFTNNIYDAARNNMFMSFKLVARTSQPLVIYNAAILSTSIEILRLSYELIKSPLNDYIAIKLLKRNVLVPLPSHRSGRIKVVVHAIKHNKHELLNWCKQFAPPMYFAYGYARIGDYDNYIKCPLHGFVDVSYYAYIGGNEDIIREAAQDNDTRYKALCKLNRYNDIPLGEQSRIFKQLSIQKLVVKQDNVEAYDLILPYVSTHDITIYIIKYNAINIARHARELQVTMRYIYNNMTREMMEILLDKINDKTTLIKVIVNTRNYKLIELLRERDLHTSTLTQKDTW